MSDKLLNDIDEFLKEKEAELFYDFASLIQILSVKGEPVGDKIFGVWCGAVLDKALEIGEKYGFQTQNHDYYCGSILFGEGGREEVGIVTHIDVVPAGDGWKYPPFVLTEKEGLYIGRGTSDDKGPMIAALYAMRYLKSKGYKLPFDVRLIMGCDEESGMTDLPYYLKTMKPPKFSFTPDADYPVCIGEKGIAEVDILLGELGEGIEQITGGTASNAVPDKAQIVLSKNVNLKNDGNVTITQNEEGKTIVVATGIAKHAAHPEGSVNAIGELAKYLCNNGIISESNKEYSMFSFLSEALSDSYGKHFGIEMSDNESGKLTCIGGMIKTVGKKVYLNINIRYPVTKVFTEIFNRLKQTLTVRGFTPTLLYDKVPYYRSPDSKEVVALMSAYKTVTGRNDEPYTTGGGTYARAFPNCVAFGVGYDEDKTLLGEGRGGAHERDEYIPKKDLFDAVKIFVLALLNL